MPWLVAGISICLAGPLGWALVLLWPAWWAAPGAQAFALGAADGAVGGWAIHRGVPMLAVLEHELTHLVVALMLLRRPISIGAGPGGGETVYTGRGSTLIRLAPYVLPTFTFAGLAFAPLVRSRYETGLVAVLGVTWGFHVLTGVIESHPRQPDLRRGGLLPSYVAVVGMSIVLYPLAAIASVGGWPLVRRWAGTAWALLA